MAYHSPGVIIIWQIAAVEAKKSNAAKIESIHLLIGACKFCDFDWKDFLAASSITNIPQRVDFEAEQLSLQQRFDRASLDAKSFRRRLRQIVAQPAKDISSSEVMSRSQESRNVFNRAEEIAAIEAREAHSYHLLQALLELPNPPWQETLREMGINNLLNSMFGDELSQKLAEPANPNVESPNLTPLLDKYGSYGCDLTLLAADGKLETIVERREPILKLARVLIKQHQRNALLIGDIDIGKTSIVKGLARRLVGANAIKLLSGKRILEISLLDLLWGAKDEVEIKNSINSLIASAGNDLIIFVKDIHIIFESSEETKDTVKLLKSALISGNIQCIGTTTSNQYSKLFEHDSQIKHRFQTIWINEVSHLEAIAILKKWQVEYEKKNSVSITDDAIKAAVEFSKLCLPYQCLPTRAIDILEQAYAAACLKSLTGNNSQRKTFIIERKDILELVSGCIDENPGTLDDCLRLDKLREVFEQLFGKDKTQVMLIEFKKTIEEISQFQSYPSNYPTAKIVQNGERPQILLRIRELTQGFIEGDKDIRARVSTVSTQGVLELTKVLIPLSGVPIEMVRAWIKEQENQNDNS